MIDTDSINLWCTIISIIVTIISIITSIWSFVSAKKANLYKEDILQFRETLDLEELLSKFQTESKYFLNHTRNREWYKGIDVNTVISPFVDILSSLGNVYPMIEDSHILKNKVHTLHEKINNYEFISDNRSVISELILDITDILQKEKHSNSRRITKL